MIRFIARRCTNSRLTLYSGASSWWRAASAATSSANAEQLGDEVFQVRRDCDEQFGMRTRVECIGIGTRAGQAGSEIGIDGAQVFQEQAVQPDQAVSLIQLGES